MLESLPPSLQIKGLLVVRKLEGEVRGGRCGRDEGVEVKLRVVPLQLEFEQVFMRTEIGSEKKTERERGTEGLEPQQHPAQQWMEGSPGCWQEAWLLWSNF